MSECPVRLSRRAHVGWFIVALFACTDHDRLLTDGTGGRSHGNPSEGGNDSGDSGTAGASNTGPSTKGQGGTRVGSTPGSGGRSETSSHRGGAASGGSGGANHSGGTANTGGSAINYDTQIAEGEFSFFTMSLTFVLSKAPCTTTLDEKFDGFTCYGGFGGDLRNGRANGIDGADSLCTEAALLAHPGDTHLWRAFLSSSNYNGTKLNAIERIGKGPWYSAPPQYSGATSYDTEGLLVSSDVSGLKQLRPVGSTAIVYQSTDGEQWPFRQCLLNEYGTCPLAEGDNHDVLTGSDTNGNLISGAGTATCDDWTSREKGYGKPQIGHSWPRYLDNMDVAVSHWCSTTTHTENGCGAILNTTSVNYGMPIQTYGGGVGSEGGYGAIYCFAFSE